MNLIYETPLSPIDIDEPWFSVQEIACLVRFLEEDGVSCSSLLNAIGLDREELEDPNTLVSARQRIDTFQFAQKYSNSSSISLVCGLEMRIAHYGLWGYALMCYPTLKDSLDFAFKHLRLAGPVMTKSLYLTADEVIFRASDSLNLKQLFPFALEVWWSSVFTFIKNDILSGDFSLCSVSVTYKKPKHWREYEKIFECPIHFGADYCEMVFSRKYMRKKPQLANMMTAQACEALCDTMLNRINHATPLVSKVRNILLRHQGEYPSLDLMAQSLRLSPRSLRRRLQEEGSSYRQISTETRFALAEQYLLNTELSIKQIASLVRFSDRANFQSAFKKWSGLTPVEFRDKIKSNG